MVNLLRIFDNGPLGRVSDHYTDADTEFWEELGAARVWTIEADGPLGTTYRLPSAVPNRREWRNDELGRYQPVDTLSPVPDRLVLGMWIRRPSTGDANQSPVLVIVEEALPTPCVFLGVGGAPGAERVVVMHQPTEGTTTGQVALLDSGPGAAFDKSEWNFFELVYDRTQGTATEVAVEVWANGVLLVSGLVTDPLGDLWVAGWFGAGTGASSGSVPIHTSHGFLADDLIGPTLTDVIRPATQGTYDEWLPANSPADLDNDLPSAAFVEGSVGDRSTYDMGTFTPVPNAGPVIGVQPLAHYANTDAAVRTLIRSGGADYSEEAWPIYTGVRYLRHFAPVQVDPDTAALWTPAGINAAEFGFEAFTP